MTELSEYNGWKGGYPTWCISLWISEGGLDYYEEMAESLDRAPLALAKALKEEFENSQSDLLPGHGPFQDILGWAMEFVDWYEIAEHIIADISDE